MRDDPASPEAPDASLPADSSEAGRAAVAEAARSPFLSELADAVSPRAAALVVGVLVLQLAFIWSYVAAFHHQSPHRVPVAVVVPPAISVQTVTALNRLPGTPVAAVAAPDRSAAARMVREDEVAGALVVDPAGTTDTVLVAGARGAAISTAVAEIFARVDASLHRTTTVRDLVPVQPGDARGLTGFYLVIGWIVGGYLVAALLGVAAGSRPATLRRAVIRLLAVIPYAVASGLGGALVVGPLLGALTGHLVALWWLGALLVFAAAAVTLAFQVLFGVVGIGVTVLVFVVLGNPSAGGAYQDALLPAFWRAIGGALPNGAATDAVRRIVYFAGDGNTRNLVVVVCYAVGGVIVALIGSALHDRAQRPARPPLDAGS